MYLKPFIIEETNVLLLRGYGQGRLFSVMSEVLHLSPVSYWWWETVRYEIPLISDPRILLVSGWDNGD